jgi:2-polyprenyl-3-methyl-5-hydroxy-6-metoxy-1,4-benzoquinol methylase
MGSVLRPDERQCPLCGGSARLGFATRDRNRRISTEPFRYRHCLDCETLSLVDVPADLGRFYDETALGDDYNRLPGPGEIEAIRASEAFKVAFLRGRVQPGRLVEIGAGSGGFAHAAHDAGFDVTVIERDERVCAHLRQAVGIEAINSDDPARELAALPPLRAIAMWHVIEHLPDPGAVLDAAAASLEPGGVLALSTPNPESLQLRVLRGRWQHVDAPRHLTLIPLAALTRRAAAAGLRRVKATTADRMSRYVGWFGWATAMDGRHPGRPSRRALTAAALLSIGLFPVEATGWRGAAYTAIFVKDGR